MKTITHKEFSVLLSENSYKNDIPSSGHFELTPLCNLDCKMCYVHLQDPTVRERMLTGEQWISIMKEAIAYGMTGVLLTGGEALTHPDFWMIYEYLIQAGVNIRLKSNGILLNEENVERLSKYPPTGIEVSLYGCDSESYLAVTGKDVYDIVTENIKRVIDAGIYLRLMITPSAYMMPWTDRVMEYAKSFGVPVVVNTLLIDAYEESGREKADFDLPVEELLRIREKSNELFPPKYMPKEEEERIYSKVTKRPDISEKGLYCNAGRTCFAVGWDGAMRPCLSFPREIACGYPLKDGFEAAWKQVNQAVKNYEVPKKCHSCEYNTKCHYCPTQHGKYSHSNQCDAKVCEFWQRLWASREESKEN